MLTGAVKNNFLLGTKSEVLETFKEEIGSLWQKNILEITAEMTQKRK